MFLLRLAKSILFRKANRGYFTILFTIILLLYYIEIMTIRVTVNCLTSRETLPSIQHICIRIRNYPLFLKKSPDRKVEQNRSSTTFLVPPSFHTPEKNEKFLFHFFVTTKNRAIVIKNHVYCQIKGGLLKMAVCLVTI